MRRQAAYFVNRLKGRRVVFARIFRENRWGGSESVSGRGSDLENTEVLRQALGGLVRRLSVQSLLDIPCGDCNWIMHSQVPDSLSYLGADIVPELISSNIARWNRPNVSFQVIDLVSSRLPRADLVLVRDCLVHLMLADGLRALRNVCTSGSRYLLTTTYPNTASNPDVPTGWWRPLNLERPPFSLPRPVFLLNEQYTGDEGRYADKSLGLWHISDLCRALRCLPATP
ncbi:MAG: class I SAM-dependent methyltransferase [Bryobacteraceae bacterium]